jgi:hypothetical protein
MGNNKMFSKYRTLFILMICIIVLFSLVRADQNFPPYMRNDKINLNFPCNLCDNTTNCNLTLQYPSTNYMVFEKSMTRNDTYYNYTLPDSSIAGNYIGSTTCCSNTTCVTQGFGLTISSTGNRVVPVWVSILGIGIMAVFLVFVAYIIGPDHAILKIVFLMFSIVLILFAIPMTLMSDVINSTLFQYSHIFYQLFIYYIILYLVWYAFKIVIYDKYIKRKGNLHGKY